MDMNMMKDILCNIGNVKVNGQKSDTEGPRLVNLCPKDKEYVIFLIRELITQVETNFALNRTVAHLKKERTRFQLDQSIVNKEVYKLDDAYTNLERKLHKNAYGKDGNEFYSSGEYHNQALENVEWALKKDRIKHKEEIEKLNNKHQLDIDMFRNKLEAMELKLAEETKKNNNLVSKVSSLIERKDCLKKELLEQCGKSPIADEDWRYLNDELRDLKADKKELEGRLQEEITEKEDLMNRIDKMKHSIEILKNEGIQQKKELATLSTERQADRRQLEMKINNLIEAKKEIEELKARLSKEKEIMSKQVNSKTNCLIDARNDADELKAKLSREKEMTSKQRKIYEDKIQRLNKEKSQLEREISKYKSKYNENQTLLSMIKELKAAKSELDEYILQESKEKELRLIQINEYEEKFNKVKAEVKFCHEHIKKVEADYHAANEELRAKVHNLEEAKEKLRENLLIEKESVVGQLNAIESEHANRDGRIKAKHEEDLRELRDEISRLKEGRARFEKELKEIDMNESKERFYLITQLKCFEEKERVWNREMKQLREKIKRFEEVENEIDLLKEKYSKLEDQLDEERKENKNLREYINELEGTVAGMRKDLAEQAEKLAKSAAKYQSEKQSLNSILGELKRAKSVIEKELTQNLLEETHEKNNLVNQLKVYEAREAALKRDLAEQTAKEDQVTRAYESECQKLEAEVAKLKSAQEELKGKVEKITEEFTVKVQELRNTEDNLRKELLGQNMAVGKLTATYENEAKELRKELERVTSNEKREQHRLVLQIKTLEESEYKLKEQLSKNAERLEELKTSKDIDNHNKQMEIYNLNQSNKLAEEKLLESNAEKHRLTDQVSKLEERDRGNVLKIQNMTNELKKLEEKHKEHVSELTYAYQTEWSTLHSDVANLRKTNQALGEELIERNRDRDKLSLQVNSLEDKVLCLSGESKEYSENVSRLRVERDSYQSERNDLREENADLINRLGRFSQESKELDDKINAVMSIRDNECRSHRREVDELKLTKTKLEAEVTDLKRELTEVGEKMSTIITVRDNECRSHRREVDDLKQTKTKLETEITDLKREVTEVNDKISTVMTVRENEYESHTREVDDLKQTKTKLEAEVEHLKREVVEVNEKISAVIGERDNNRTGLQSKIYDLLSEKKKLENLVSGLSREVNELKEALSTSKAEKGDDQSRFQSKIYEYQEAKKSLEDSLSGLNRDNNELKESLLNDRILYQSKLYELQGVKKHLQETVDDLSKGQKEHENEILGMHSRVNELLRIKTQLENRIESLNSELSEHDKKHSILQLNVSELLGMNLQLEKTVTDLTKTLKEYSEKITSMDDELTVSKQSKENAERALETVGLEENEEKLFLSSRLRTLEDILCLVLRENIVIYAEKREIHAHASELKERCEAATRNAERLEADLRSAGARVERRQSVDRTTQTSKLDSDGDPLQRGSSQVVWQFYGDSCG